MGLYFSLIVLQLYFYGNTGFNIYMQDMNCLRNALNSLYSKMPSSYDLCNLFLSFLDLRKQFSDMNMH